MEPWSTPPDLGGALNASLQNAGLPGVTGPKQNVDWARRQILADTGSGPSQSEPRPSGCGGVVEQFSQSLRNHVAERSTPYAGVVDTLDALRNRAANLPLSPTSPPLHAALLSELSLDGYFQSVVCGDTAALPKPAPDPILLYLKQLGVTASCI